MNIVNNFLSKKLQELMKKKKLKDDEVIPEIVNFRNNEVELRFFRFLKTLIHGNPKNATNLFHYKIDL